ncbi:hypothetical protein HK101_011993 [Irineochytrium annulatum]|nr:hypothetical protein HK101_011993 [Irineochytrium annulatum]
MEPHRHKFFDLVDGVLDLLRPKVVTDRMVVYCLQKIVGARLKYMWTGHFLAPSVLDKLTAKRHRKAGLSRLTPNLVVHHPLVDGVLDFTREYITDQIMKVYHILLTPGIARRLLEAYLIHTQNWLGLPHGILQHPGRTFVHLAAGTARRVLCFVAQVAEAGLNLDPVLNREAFGWGHVAGGAIPLAAVLPRAQYWRARRGMEMAGWRYLEQLLAVDCLALCAVTDLAVEAEAESDAATAHG